MLVSAERGFVKFLRTSFSALLSRLLHFLLRLEDCGHQRLHLGFAHLHVICHSGAHLGNRRQVGSSHVIFVVEAV